MFVESVRIYVIRPISPRPPSLTPSYSCWATAIVRFAVKPRRREASCCSVLVMNGAVGRRTCGRVCTVITVYADSRRFVDQPHRPGRRW